MKLKVRCWWPAILGVIAVGLVTTTTTVTADRSELYDGDYDQKTGGGQLHVPGERKKILTAVGTKDQGLSAGRALKLEVKRVPNFAENGENSIFGGMDREFLKVLQQVMSDVKGVDCMRDLNATLEAIERREAWAVAMLDASAKSTAGIEYGQMYHFGHFDQCMAINRDRDSGLQKGILSQYCLADVRLDAYQERMQVSRRVRSNESSVVHWGVCVPVSCKDGDVARVVEAISGSRDVTIPKDACHREVNAEPSTLDIVYVSIIMFFVLMVALSTLYHVQSICSRRNEKKTTMVYILRSFSIIENLKKLGQDSKDDHGLGCINGIKAVAMFTILSGHALLFLFGGASYNPGFYYEQSKYIRNAFLLNSPLLVDTFLLLSGFLFARLLLIELEKRRGKINFGLLYLFRYIRLTPAYGAIIALYATWLPRLGSGPLWNQRMLLEQARCRESWWRNALYINNYLGTDSICMFQSWYLAADSQLFVLAPLLLYPLWRYGRRTGAVLLGTVAAVSVAIPFLVTYYGKLDPSLLIFADEVTDLQSNSYFANVYVKTHMRATAYIFGLVAGYLVHIMQQKNITIGKWKLFFFWTASTVIGTVSMLSITTFYNSTGTDNYLFNASYAALHRLGWSLSNGWLVLACVTGHAGPLKKFLSSRLLVPISRLTYCAYLTNGLVELYFSASQRVPLYGGVINMTAVTLSHVILTFLTALCLCLVFESPIHGIEKIFLRQSRPASGRATNSSGGQQRTATDDKGGAIVANNNSSGTASTQSTSDDSSA
ncbi:nose resistant to fluoxetine protein 6 [Aedes albopictus]|uniref:Nose resistant-to-fluoxetine protein N-terminal domain-containing protein n=1 Tax=Aedes albopictus TaxID=7160 RepID=A0ABM1XT71_AEDAL|nr:nose resistant to fluoxetine protein 6-like [Aedes albopictus]